MVGALNQNGQEQRYHENLENDNKGLWTCFSDVANGHDVDYMASFARGNWTALSDDDDGDVSLATAIPTNRAVGTKDVAFKGGETVKIFVKSDIESFRKGVKDIITQYAQPYINLKFQFLDSEAGANITFDNNFKAGGVTTCVGCRNTSISISSASKALVLHELGHAMGLYHEMKNPNIKITWIESVLAQRYDVKDSASFVRRQITAPLSNPSAVLATEFDKESIMMYNLPSNTNKQGVDIGTTTGLYTDLDKKWFAMTYGPPPGERLGMRDTPASVQNQTGWSMNVDVGMDTSSGKDAICIVTLTPSWLDAILAFILSLFK